MREQRRIALAGALWLSAGLVAVAVTSCELAVPQASFDDVRCQQEGQVGPPACPDGLVCTSGRCVSPSSFDAGGTGGNDASVTPGDDSSTGGTSTGGTSGSGGTAGQGGDSGGTGGDDASTGGDGGTAGMGGTGGGSTDAAEEPFEKRPLGASCSAPSDCLTGVCLEVPDSGGQRYCSQYCCSSFNCPAGTVCSAFWGNQLCVEPGAVGLALPGASAGPAGATCGDGTQCRSGRCGNDGQCKDVCCVDDSCPNGKACEATAEFGQLGWYCSVDSVGTNGGNGDSCGSGSDCDSNRCLNYGSKSCDGPCCKDADCSALGLGAFCDYVMDGDTPVRQCFPWVAVAPNENQACCNDANCPSGQHCVPVHSTVVSALPLFPDEAWVFRCQ